MDFKGVLGRGVDQKNIWAFVLIALVGAFFSALIPPLQSPDERDHIKRAYLLTKGEIILETPTGHASGGRIDTGLNAYLRGFQDVPHHPGKKISKEELNSVSGIEWTGETVFSPAPGTGYYFPLAYIPQALGLSIGKALGLSVNASYWSARFFVLVFSAVAIAAAFSITPANVFLFGLLILPMSIFQLSSASLDAFTTALTVLATALFLRGANNKLEFPAWMSRLLALCILILATSRMHMLPLLILLLLVWVVRRNNESLLQFLVVTAFSIVWLIVSINATSGNSAATAGHSVAQYVSYYAQAPSLLGEVLFNTVSKNYDFYKMSFIGVLGWLDTQFDHGFYSVVGNCLLLLAIFSISPKNIRDEWQSRLGLIGVSMLSAILVFLALLVSWNPLPTTTIEGVQGRYFIGPLIVLGYSLSGSNSSIGGKFGKYGFVPLVFMAFMVATHMPRVLVERYFMPQHEIPEVRFKIKPSKQIVTLSSYTLAMTELHRNDTAGLFRVGVMFWHKDGTGDGEARLVLKGPDAGEVFHRNFLLKDVASNEYHFFDLDSRRYTQGEIAIVSGGGVSVWESRGGYGVNTCIIYEYVNGKRRFTPGCPVY